MSNEEKLCPMKFRKDGQMTVTEIYNEDKDYYCHGAMCAWWIPFDDVTATVIDETGRCALCAINGNIRGVGEVLLNQMD